MAGARLYPESSVPQASLCPPEVSPRLARLRHASALPRTPGVTQEKEQEVSESAKLPVAVRVTARLASSRARFSAAESASQQAMCASASTSQATPTSIFTEGLTSSFSLSARTRSMSFTTSACVLVLDRPSKIPGRPQEQGRMLLLHPSAFCPKLVKLLLQRLNPRGAMLLGSGVWALALKSI